MLLRVLGERSRLISFTLREGIKCPRQYLRKGPTPPAAARLVARTARRFAYSIGAMRSTPCRVAIAPTTHFAGICVRLLRSSRSSKGTRFTTPMPSKPARLDGGMFMPTSATSPVSAHETGGRLLSVWVWCHPGEALGPQPGFRILLQISRPPDRQRGTVGPKRLVEPNVSGSDETESSLPQRIAHGAAPSCLKKRPHFMRLASTRIFPSSVRRTV